MMAKEHKKHKRHKRRDIVSFLRLLCFLCSFHSLRLDLPQSARDTMTAFSRADGTYDDDESQDRALAHPLDSGVSVRTRTTVPPEPTTPRRTERRKRAYGISRTQFEDGGIEGSRRIDAAGSPAAQLW